MSYEKEEDFKVQCRCGTHILSIRHDKECQSWFLSMFKLYLHEKIPFIFRIKLAVKIALKGCSAFWDDQIIISDENMKGLIDHLVEKQKEIEKGRKKR